jgi:hypothetical protein
MPALIGPSAHVLRHHARSAHASSSLPHRPYGRPRRGKTTAAEIGERVGIVVDARMRLAGTGQKAG